MAHPEVKALTPISAHGTSKSGRIQRTDRVGIYCKMSTQGRQQAHGFTLIEMLVAVMVMGLFLGLVSTIARPDERAALRLEADRLAHLLDLAAEESRITGKRIAWTGDETGYRFARLSESGWSDIREAEFLRPRALPRGMLISGFLIGNMRPQRGMRLEFSPHGPAYSFSIEMSMGTEYYQVVASPIGEVHVTPGKGPRTAAMSRQAGPPAVMGQEVCNAMIARG